MSGLAFEIGFDHYRFDLPLDISRFQDNHRQQIRYGYEAAKHQQVTQKKPDLYERKIMTLRDRALVKGLDVSISVKDLQKQLEQTNGCCPITELPFTFAENNATDWSIDRVDNTRGYCPDNIVIVSVLANQAKSDLDLAGLIKNALGKSKTDDLLTTKQRLRMAQFYYKRMKIMKPLCMCLMLTDTQPLYDHIVFMQLFKNEEKRAKAFLKKLEKYSGKAAVMKATKLTQKRIYHRADIDVEVLYDSPKLYKWVQSFILAINFIPVKRYNTGELENSSIDDIAALSNIGIKAEVYDKAFGKTLNISSNDLIFYAKAKKLTVRQSSGNQYTARVRYPDTFQSVRMSYGLLIIPDDCPTISSLPQARRTHRLETSKVKVILPIEIDSEIFIKES